MNPNRTVIGSIALALFLAAGAPTPLRAQEAAPGLSVTGTKGSATVRLGGVVIRSTRATVTNQRLIRFAETGTVIALWEESQGRADPEPYYALSTDGGRTFALVLPTTYDVRLVYAQFDPGRKGEPTVPAELRAAAESSVYLVQFVTPPIEEFRRQIGAWGGVVERFLTDHTHVVTMSAETAARLRGLPYVRWVGAYHPAYRLSAEIRAELESQQDAGAQRYSIECFRRGPGQQQRVADAITALGGVVDILTRDGFRMEATLTRAQLLAVARMDEVNYIDPWGGPGGIDMNVIRQLVGAMPVVGAAGFTGQGVRGEVFDTEVRVSHAAFQNPPPLIHRESEGDAGTPHGSSVYGINFANWAANPNFNGVCLNAEQGIFCDYTLASQFGGPVTRLVLNTEATDPDGDFRSSYHTSSVGNAQITTYSTISAEVDDYLFKVDYLSFQSQSNTGNRNSRPQAWAKNIVSVGGVQWMGTLTRTDDNWGNGASIGPAADNRVKPDLTNCYDAIPTTDNANNTATTNFGGTSGATPITAGCSGILMQMWHEGVFPNQGEGSSILADRPKSSTAKAMLINTAFKYPLTQGGLNRAAQGWGMVNLETLYNMKYKMFTLDEADSVTNAQTRTYPVTVAAGEPLLNITMVYRDPPGTPGAAQARINDLSLRATAPNGTTIYWGNNGLGTANVSPTGGVANTVDTVENIFVQNPTAGNWTISVVGTAVVQDANPATTAVDASYALIATGVVGPALSMKVMGTVPTLVPPGAGTDIQVRIKPAAQGLQAGSPALKYRFSPGGQYLTSPMVSQGNNLYLATIPPPACGDQVEFYFTATGSQSTVVNLPATVPTAVYAANVGFPVDRFLDDMEQDRGWSGVAPEDTAVTGRWTRGVPQVTEAQPELDHTVNGNQCWITDFRAGQQVSDFDIDDGRTTLTTPLFDGTGMNDATIAFWLWYSNAVGPVNPNTNSLQIDITNNDGVSWVPVETVGPTGTETVGAWTKHSFLISSRVVATEQMRMRFIASDLTGAIVEAAVDDFSVTGWTCPGGNCYANCDGSATAPVLNIQDFACFLNRFQAGETYANCDGSTGAPVLNVQDFTCFINAFQAGCS